jgi:hypothetical protein
MARFKTYDEIHVDKNSGLHTYTVCLGDRQILLLNVFLGMSCITFESNNTVRVMSKVGPYEFSESFTVEEYRDFKELCLVDEAFELMSRENKCTCDSRELFINGCKCGGK